jgi:RNA polymerase sigma-70 factor (ECF subfamily)
VQDETRRRVQEAIADLSPQQQQVLQLRAAGLRYREIAETIGIGTSTVNEFMRRAVARLRKAIT